MKSEQAAIDALNKEVACVHLIRSLDRKVRAKIRVDCRAARGEAGRRCSASMPI
jgi:hypothetical protein